MAQGDVRQYTVQAHSSNTFGRVLCNVRNHHFVVDGPVQNGCPGEEITPAELFLSGVAACGVELLQVIARAQGVSLRSTDVSILGTVDRSRPVRPDVTVFNSVKLKFQLGGVNEQQGRDLVETFKNR